MRGFAAVALAITVYLFLSIPGHANPVGCGPNLNCENALAGPWSQWFGIPVAALGAATYLLMLLTTFPIARAPLTRRRTRPVRAMLALTAAAAFAGAWLTAVQLAGARGLCPYCVATHVCGILAAAAAWSRASRPQRKCVVPALAALAALVAGQVLPNPQPFQAKADVITPTVPSRVVPAGRVLTFTAGGRQFELDPAALPTLGSPRAARFIVILSDYTCEHCRTTHRMLDRSLPKFGDEVGVIVLPALLDPACNPCLPAGVTHPLPQDCALTRLAVAVFLANREAFPRMNEWLFAEDRVRGEAEARAFATQLVGAEPLAAAERDPRVTQIIATGCQLFARTGSGALPKMLIGSTAISGPVDQLDPVREPFRREWGLSLSR